MTLKHFSLASICHLLLGLLLSRVVLVYGQSTDPKDVSLLEFDYNDQLTDPYDDPQGDIPNLAPASGEIIQDQQSDIVLAGITDGVPTQTEVLQETEQIIPVANAEQDIPVANPGQDVPIANPGQEIPIANPGPVLNPQVGEAPLQNPLDARIKLDPEIQASVSNRFSELLAQARQKVYPSGPPTAIPESDVPPEMSDPYSHRHSIVLTRAEWDQFLETVEKGFGDTQAVDYIWWSCSNIVNFRRSFGTLLARTAMWISLNKKDKELTERIAAVGDKYWNLIRYVTNWQYKPPDQITGKYAPGICDPPQGVLSAPTEETWRNVTNHKQLRDDLIKRRFQYQELTSDEIIIQDDGFLANFDAFVRAHTNLVTWLNKEFTPLMKDINTKYFPKQDLLSNTHFRPAGVWDRRALGYNKYYKDKYAKIYQFIPAEFGYWGIWDLNTIDKLPGSVQNLLFATHATAVGLIRGALPFAVELMIDLGAKAWSTSMSSRFADPEFAIPNKDDKSTRTFFGLSPLFMEQASERTDHNFRRTPVFGESEPAGVEDWDDEVEMARNEWRDTALAKLKRKDTLPTSADESGPSTGASTPEVRTQARPAQPKGNAQTKWRKTKGQRPR